MLIILILQTGVIFALTNAELDQSLNFAFATFSKIEPMGCVAMITNEHQNLKTLSRFQDFHDETGIILMQNNRPSESIQKVLEQCRNVIIDLRGKIENHNGYMR